MLGVYILPSGCFISQLMAQHWKLSLSPKLGVLSWSVGPFPAYDGTVSVLVSRAVVALVDSKTLYVCRSSVRSVREGMTFLDFMSVSLNYFGHLCTCKLGHLFSFLLLFALGQRKKEFSLLSAVSLPIVF